MAKFTVGKAMTDYIALLGDLRYRADGLAGKAIFEGARIVADQIHANIQALPVKTDNFRKGEVRDPVPAEIEGMLEGLGIARKQTKNGFINVKIGMDGYNNYVTEKYPKGHPNAMMARTINAGSTYMKRHPFINQAVRAQKANAEEAMKEIIEEGINETMQQ